MCGFSILFFSYMVVSGEIDRSRARRDIGIAA